MTNDTVIKLLLAAIEGEYTHECAYELLQLAEAAERLEVPGEQEFWLIEGIEEEDVIIAVGGEGPTEAIWDIDSQPAELCDELHRAVESAKAD